jgi:hypothetical protein
MDPLTLFDSLATPLYDAFDSTAQNNEPYTALAPSQSRTATNPASGSSAKLASHFDLTQPDRISQRDLDAQLWKSVHGMSAKPPPPGPNAVDERGRDGDG